jgi:regulatory protein
MENDYEKARKYLLNLINYKDYTIYEIEKKLTRRGYTQDIIKILLKYVKESGFIDPKAQIARIIEKNTKGTPKGRYIIRRKLEEKGFKKDEYGKSLDSIDEEPLARAALDKRMKKSFKNKEKNEIKQYLYKFLATKGFGYDTIEKIVNERFKNMTDDDFSE